jgi:glycosyltransferase involved in cell wall biosynthesis
MRLNFLAYMYLPHDGYGRTALKTVLALLHRGVSVWPSTADFIIDHPTWLLRANGFDPSVTTIGLMPPKHLPTTRWGRVYNWTMTESTSWPKEWALMANERATRMLVPSPWQIPVMKDMGVTLPISVVPLGIDPNECHLIFRKPPQDRPFTFLCLGDRGGRKGSDLAWTAFYKAFGDNKDVRLMVKTRPGSKMEVDLSLSDKRVSIWRGDTDDATAPYAFADCYVFPTRGEGAGLPPREAAACGLPVIATRWSGTADDADSWCYPIGITGLVKSTLPWGGLWAAPSLDELVERMRWIYEHQDEAMAFGYQAGTWLHENWTWDHTAKRLMEGIERWG